MTHTRAQSSLRENAEMEVEELINSRLLLIEEQLQRKLEAKMEDQFCNISLKIDDVLTEKFTSLSKEIFEAMESLNNRVISSTQGTRTPPKSRLFSINQII
ncbi:unnamed protein product [Cuscuta epithymum]|uniref:Uncharacterized protein n=1 Tax=Cuscuta epithymum TaxID=186058 RepID=A0AAV0FND2_9ASTE|nr:unnamed protein product [Cuscuta epithymum]